MSHLRIYEQYFLPNVCGREALSLTQLTLGFLLGNDSRPPAVLKYNNKTLRVFLSHSGIASLLTTILKSSHAVQKYFYFSLKYFHFSVKPKPDRVTLAKAYAP